MSRKPELKGRAARLARLFPAGPRRAARTPFVLLVVLLLGGGLIGLLVLNSALSEGSFRMDDLQRDTKSLTDEEQSLQRDIDSYSAPDALQRRARELGMVPGGDPAFLNPDGTVKGLPSAAPLSAGDAADTVRPPEAIPLSGATGATGTTGVTGTTGLTGTAGRTPSYAAPTAAPVPSAFPAPAAPPVSAASPAQGAASAPTAAIPTTPGR